MIVVTSLAERIDIVKSSEAGEEAWRISRRMGWRMATIRKWRNRGRKLGRAGLVSSMGRPPKGALSGFPQELSAILLEWRQEHPGWGPITVRIELEQHPAFHGQKLPAPSSIGRLLKEQGLIKPYGYYSGVSEGGRKGRPSRASEMASMTDWPFLRAVEM